MKRLFALVGIAVAALLVLLVVRAATFTSRQVAVTAAEKLALDVARAPAVLAKALSFATVSNADEAKVDYAAFAALTQHLDASFPAAMHAMQREVVADHSQLYVWRGRRPELPPILLMAHMDVVPVEPGTDATWTHPPYAGAVADGYVWGRGAMDFKVGVVALLEAVDNLAARGFTPERTIYLSFGHDEEVGGKGATAVAQLLKSRKIAPAFVLDEGLTLVEGFPGLERPVALIGIAEKGYASVVLEAQSDGGHSSMPPRDTAIGLLSRAITRLEAEQMPARLEGPARDLFAYVGPEMSFGKRLVIANLWLFEGIFLGQLGGTPASNALIRTTTAPTIFQSGVKENVLPSQARAVLNFRILPGDDPQAVLAHVNAVVGDPRIHATLGGEIRSDPSPISGVTTPGFRVIQKTIGEIFPDAVVAPSIVVGATDARHMAILTPDVYRFSPQRLGVTDRARFHGKDERIGVENYLDAVRFYVRLIENSGGLE